MTDCNIFYAGIIMENRLFDDRFKKFIRGINTKKSTVADIVDYTKSSMGYLAEALHLGRMEVMVEVKVNIVEKMPYKVQELLYQSPNGYEGELFSMDFMTGNKIVIVMNAYPEKGYSWNEDEKDDLYFMCSVFFTLYERARLSDIVNEIAFTDSLTGAMNTDGFLRQYAQTKQRIDYSDFVVGYVNIKNMKLINRELGMRNGDKLLRGFVDFIKSYMLPEEMIARLGGDNFIIAIRGYRVDSLMGHLTPLTLNVDADGRRIDVDLTFRIGFYRMTKGADLGEGIPHSGTAFALTRQPGYDDVVWYSEEMEKTILQKQKTAYEFKQALVNHEFMVCYQPKVRLEKDELCGAEALVRWKKDGKVIPPMSFIPVLEKDGSICELDFYVFEKVCQDIRFWIDNDMKPVTISVNFSKNHLKNDNFARQIISIIERYNIDSKYIEIELTETACHDDYDKLKSFIDLMKQYEIKVSIDDFGTGISSFGLLKDLKVNVIKLDQSFVRALDQDNINKIGSTEIVIKNIINMVNELDMEIIAEGVETREEADFLKKVSCDMAQGYLFDRPLEKESYEVVLRGDRKYLKKV